VYLGEYASWGNKLKNALAEAAYMISLERNGDVVNMASYAPLLAKKNHTQWKTDMIFFDNTNICLTPNYYVQKMFMTHQGGVYFDNVVTKNKNDTTLAASCVQDSETGDIILKMANTGAEPKKMDIDLSGFKGIHREAEKTILTGNSDAENTFENPKNVVPSTSEIKITSKFKYEVPANSLTVLRIKAKR